MSYMSKFVAALLALLAMAIIVSRQVFLSIVTRDPSGLSTVAGRTHLWLALGACISAGIAGILMFRFFGLHEKNKWSKVELTPTGPHLICFPVNYHQPADRFGQTLGSPIPGFQRVSPMTGHQWTAPSKTAANSSGQRAFARRTHQSMFKKWSRTRHD